MIAKRYTSDIHRIYDNGEYLACADTMDDAEIIVNKLNRERTLVEVGRRRMQAMVDLLKEEIDKSDGELRDSLIRVLNSRLDI